MSDYCCDMLAPFIVEAIAEHEKNVDEIVRRRLAITEGYIEHLLEGFKPSQEIAQSATRDFWTCAECGTVLGHVNLLGKGGDKWSRFPFYCPGCGKKTGYNAVRLSKSREQVAYIEGGD